jgi:hypothetical protein
MYFGDRTEWQRISELTYAIKQLSEKWNLLISNLEWKIGNETPCEIPVELHIQEYEDKVENEVRLLMEGNVDYIYAQDKIQKWKKERQELVKRVMDIEDILVQDR